jgi:hypothetical protein
MIESPNTVMSRLLPRFFEALASSMMIVRTITAPIITPATRAEIGAYLGRQQSRTSAQSCYPSSGRAKDRRFSLHFNKIGAPDPLLHITR